MTDAPLCAMEAKSLEKLDAFFVGFSPYAEQDVFSKEIDFVTEAISAAFNAGGRSMLLITHRDTVASRPLVNEPILRRAHGSGQ